MELGIVYSSLTKDQLFKICGHAPCNCYTHAANGEPCVHDIKLAVSEGRLYYDSNGKVAYKDLETK